MLKVDLKKLLGSLNPFCQDKLQAAAGLCMSLTHYEVTLEHLLLKLNESSRSDLSLVMRHFGLEQGELAKYLGQVLEDFRTGNAGRPVMSQVLIDLIQDAWTISSLEFRDSGIRSGVILLSLLRDQSVSPSADYAAYLRSMDRNHLSAEFAKITAGSVEEPGCTDPDRGVYTDTGSGELAEVQYCVDFTTRARNGDIDPVFGREESFRRVIDVLARRRKNNPLIVGDAGVGKTALVEGLALRIVEHGEDIPAQLRDVSILGLDTGLLEAGAGLKGEFENRLKTVINEIMASSRPIILFIDDAHTLMDPPSRGRGGDGAALLKPVLARGELRTIAATTWTEYNRTFARDPALSRRFQLIKLDEPSVVNTITMLRGLKYKYEEAHGVSIRDDAVVAAAELADRYLTGRLLPDKAVDLLDVSAARVKIGLSAKPFLIADLETRMRDAKRRIDGLCRDRRDGAAIDEQALEMAWEQMRLLKAQVYPLRDKWEKEQALASKLVALRREASARKGVEPREEPGEGETANGGNGLERKISTLLAELKTVQNGNPLVRFEVDPDVVARGVSDWTGIPLGKLLQEEASTVMSLRENLSARIRGQGQALEIISRNIRAAKTGLRDPRQPLGVFLLMGPSGVGKTETALCVSDLLFGDEDSMIAINMSEFQEKHTVSRLIGSPPGYVGYGEGGVLTDAVRRRPYSVVLLDEAEKGHIDVMNLFYQVFDKGVLADGEGRRVDFSNTIVFLTSNLGSEEITRLCKGNKSPAAEDVINAVRPILSEHFKPALLARMTPVPYYALPMAALREIVSLKLDRLRGRVRENNKVEIGYTEAVVESIANQCDEVETGARNIDHVLRNTLLPRLSEDILARMVAGEVPQSADLDVDGQGGYVAVVK